MSRRRFFIAFGVLAVLIAGTLSYLASSSPDGLDSVARHGCTAEETAGGERLTGGCIARDEADHALGSGPLAGYTIGGDDGFVGLAGVIGVLATLAISTGLFWLLRRRSPGSTRD